MAIEHAGIRAVQKPWGRTDLRPWSDIAGSDMPIGELWFERKDPAAPDPALLLKLLFTAEPLSIQVHPDDAFARMLGLPNGKTEAWYILSAPPGTAVAVGLKRRLSTEELHAAIEDGSIAGLVAWQPVVTDDVVFVPAGTIHAIGAGLVVAEIQQASDATFRLFDYGRHRAVHADDAVAAADAGPAPHQTAPTQLSDARTLLVASKPFVLERIELPPGSRWDLDVRRETWVLVLDGGATIGAVTASTGEAVFIDAERAGLVVGPLGFTGLVAYPGPKPEPGLISLDIGQETGAFDRRTAAPPVAAAGRPVVAPSPATAALSPTLAAASPARGEARP